MTRDIPVNDIPLERWVEAHQQLKDDGYTFFDFLTAVDETDRDEPHFQLVTHLYDIRGGAKRSTLTRTNLPAPDDAVDAPQIASLSGLWPGACWHERETYEMFGIDFAGFDDGTGRGLRKLLLPEAFTGTPLRKSFILTARVSKPWPGAKEPGEGREDAPKRRKMLPPGVPAETWGPR